MGEKVIKWEVGGWRKYGYVIDYKVNGIVNCTFIGVPNDRENCFKMYFDSRAPYGEVPKVDKVSFFDVGKDIRV